MTPSPTLPPVGSVWRHSETGVIREFLGQDGAWVDIRSTDGCRSIPAKAWLDWQAHATRLDAAPPPLTLEEAELIANIFAAYPIDPCEDVNLAIRKQAEWLRDYINNRNRKETQ